MRIIIYALPFQFELSDLNLGGVLVGARLRGQRLHNIANWMRRQKFGNITLSLLICVLFYKFSYNRSKICYRCRGFPSIRIDL